MFCALNGHYLHTSAEDAVQQIFAAASREVDEAATAEWIAARLRA